MGSERTGGGRADQGPEHCPFLVEVQPLDKCLEPCPHPLSPLASVSPSDVPRHSYHQAGWRVFVALLQGPHCCWRAAKPPKPKWLAECWEDLRLAHGHGQRPMRWTGPRVSHWDGSPRSAHWPGTPPNTQIRGGRLFTTWALPWCCLPQEAFLGALLASLMTRVPGTWPSSSSWTGWYATGCELRGAGGPLCVGPNWHGLGGAQYNKGEASLSPRMLGLGG